MSTRFSFSVVLFVFGSFAAVEPAPLPSLAELPPLPGRFTVAGAYEAIPHRRTIFAFEKSSIAEGEKEYLRLMFELIDRGIVLRVSAYQSFYYGYEDRKELLDGMSALASFVEHRVTPPKELGSYHGKVLAALDDQREFFSEWLGQGSRFRYREGRSLGGHPRVARSSQALRAAYGILMSRYGAHEAIQNRNAFFDYHCALDFL